MQVPLRVDEVNMTNIKVEESRFLSDLMEPYDIDETLEFDDYFQLSDTLSTANQYADNL